jgi:hypothetical protein
MRLFQLVCLAELRWFTRQPPLRQFEQHERLRLVDLEKNRRMDVDADQDNARIIDGSVPRITLLSKPHLPIRLVELVDFATVTRQTGDA